MQIVMFTMVTLLLSVLCFTIPAFILTPVKIMPKYCLVLYPCMLLVNYFLMPYSEFVLPCVAIIGLLILMFITTKNKFTSVLITGLSFFISYISDGLLGIIFAVLKIDLAQFFVQKPYNMYVFYLFVFVIEIILAGAILYVLDKRIKYKELNLHGKQAYLLCVFLVFSIVVYLVTTVVSKKNGLQNALVVTNGLLLMAYFSIILVIILYLLKYSNQEIELQKNELELKYKEELLSQLKLYTTEIEKTYDETRKIRHNFSNTLLTISGYLEEKKYDALEEYFNKSIYPIKQSMDKYQNKLGCLYTLKVSEVKGLMTIKMMEAYSSNIDFVFESTPNITEIQIDMLTFCQMLGIILDNAIEEAKLCEHPFIRCACIQTDKTFELVVKNSCRDSLPSVREMLTKGFSTKGDNRGLGLAQLNELVNQNDHLTMDINCEEGFAIKIVYTTML